MTHATAQGWCEGCPGHRPQCPMVWGGKCPGKHGFAPKHRDYSPGFPENIHDNDLFARARPKIQLFSVGKGWSCNVLRTIAGFGGRAEVGCLGGTLHPWISRMGLLLLTLWILVLRRQVAVQSIVNSHHTAHASFTPLEIQGALRLRAQDSKKVWRCLSCLHQRAERRLVVKPELSKFQIISFRIYGWKNGNQTHWCDSRPFNVDLSRRLHKRYHVLPWLHKTSTVQIPFTRWANWWPLPWTTGEDVLQTWKSNPPIKRQTSSSWLRDFTRNKTAIIGVHCSVLYALKFFANVFSWIKLYKII